MTGTALTRNASIYVRIRAASAAWGAAVLVLAALVAIWPRAGADEIAVPVAPGVDAAPAARGVDAVPMAARGPVSAALGRHDPAYWVHASRAANPAQRLTARFRSSDVMIAAGPAWAEMRLTSYGHVGALQRVVPARPRGAANRIAYRHGALTEWYANGPFGLEQGFDVHVRPEAGAGPLTLSLALHSNLSVRRDGAGILLTGRGEALRYDGLAARDAAGRRLRAWFALRHGAVTIAVADRGASYPIHIDPIVQQAELTASDGLTNDVLGATLAMDGDTIVAAAPNKTVGTNSGQGALYVFVKPPDGWADAHQTAELTSSDGTALAEVAVEGDTIVAGAPGKKIGANQDQGAAYVFVKPADGWHDGTQTAVLTASDGAAEDALGSGVAISGDTIVVGAPGRNSQRGAGYVFVKPSSGWKDATQTAVLTALGGGAQDSVGLINSVAVSGDTIVLGGSNHKVGDHANQGQAYVYVKPDAGWSDATQTATLDPTDGGAGDLFGFAVAVSSDTVVVGAPHHAVGRQAPGAAYVFTEPPFGWGQRANDTESAELTPSDGATDDRFGAQVGISGTTVFAGSFLHQVGPNPAQGAVYFFNRPGFVWSDEHEGGQLTASDGAAREGFADTLAVSGDLVAAGAPIHAVGQNLGQGAVYLFGVPPTITTVTPAANATYTQGQAVLASYVCSAATATTLTSCSGPVAAGARLDTSTVGAHSFAVRALDSDGSSATQTTTYTVTAAPTTTAPSITNVHESATRWRTGRRGGQSRRRAPIGTTFSFTLDQPAAVTLAFTRGSRIAAGALEVKGRAGDNQVRFRGRLSSGRTLRPGAYAVTVTATNEAQQRTTHRPLHFRIVR